MKLGTIAYLQQSLIFVYIIGRNNSLLHHTVQGRIQPEMFLAYILCTLAVIQIWNYSAYYINIFGRNGLREHIFLFTNMFLLYFVADGTRQHWRSSHTQYHVAWALILLNVALQYFIEVKKQKKGSPHVKMVVVLLVEALMVLAMIPLYKLTGMDFSYVPILFGMVCSFIPAGRGKSFSVDFAHLSERAMLYVVFTFGEMVIAIAGYFEGEFSFNTVYFALMAFLTIVGLFLSYGTFYDRIIDREKKTSGLWYMFLHVFIIFGLNNITTSLEFMQDSSIKLVPKLSFLILSFLIFFVFLFMTRRFAKLTCKPPLKFYMKMAALAVSFIVLMILFRENMYINIALSVVYVFAVYGIIYKIGRKNSSQKPTE